MTEEVEEARKLERSTKKQGMQNGTDSNQTPSNHANPIMNSKNNTIPLHGGEVHFVVELLCCSLVGRLDRCNLGLLLGKTFGDDDTG